VHYRVVTRKWALVQLLQHCSMDVVVPVKRIGVPDVLVDHAEPDQQGSIWFNQMASKC